MAQYYFKLIICQVALKEVVDNFSKLAIEACLISKLPELFAPQIVYELSDNTVSRIAAESWEIADERRFLTDKLEVLASGMTELQRLSKHHQRTNGKLIGRVPSSNIHPIYSDVKLRL